MGYLKGKSTLMIYDRHPELQSKWDKAFWAREYYVSTISNITEDANKEIHKRAGRRVRGEKIQVVPLYKWISNSACDTLPFERACNRLYEGQSKPPFEVVVVT